MEVRMRGENFIDGLRISLLTWRGRLSTEQQHLKSSGDIVKCEQCSNTSKNGMCVDCVSLKVRLMESQLESIKLHYDN